ncbi:amidohydrolase family protein [Amycolatopsis sacchari]|uniref:amidohydrolase family protein n=1 Tax=Amycolatopsis sacchari TaxID=115433 RepID=UPI003EBCBD50
MIVDHQTHWYPRTYLDALAGRSRFPRVERTADGGYTLWLDEGSAQPAMDRLTKDVDEHLVQATEAGIDTLVLGPATLGEVLHLSALEAADLLDILHQEYAAAQRAHPDRVACLAALPMQEPSAALAVLERAVTELGLRGVSLVAHNEGRPLVDDGTLAVFARIAELGVPLFLHPGFRSTTRAHTRVRRAENGLGWMFQTALAALELIDGGVFDVAPGLVVVHPHLGGVLPYVAGRISGLAGSAAKHPLEHYLRTCFYVDTAAATPPALRLAIEMYGADRLVFASDYPFLPMTELRRYVEDNLPAETATQIYTNRVPGLLAPPAEAEPNIPLRK